MFYMIYNKNGKCPHIVDDIDDFIIEDEMLHAHSLSKGNINLWREMWDVIRLTYYSFGDYMLNQEVKNGKNQIH